MSKIIKNYKDFITEKIDAVDDNMVNENEVAEPRVKPRTDPGTTPKTTPNRPSPIRRDKPSFDPKPKASERQIVDKFLDLAKNNKEIMNILKNKYSK